MALLTIILLILSMIIVVVEVAFALVFVIPL